MSIQGESPGEHLKLDLTRYWKREAYVEATTHSTSKGLSRYLLNVGKSGTRTNGRRELFMPLSLEILEIDLWLEG